MKKSTSELTIEYIKEHPYIKNCLKKGLINYSALARLISEELGIQKKSSKEAVLVAARRFRDKLKNEYKTEEEIKTLLKKSEIEIKTKIDVFVLNKSIDIDTIDKIQKNMRKENRMSFFLEGSDNYTFIFPHKYADVVYKSLSGYVIKKHENLVMIIFKSPKEIENTKGVVAYLAGLFSENDINIIEFLSCWTDTLFIIEPKDVNKALNFLDF
jgi:hypothetical protein